MPGRLTLKLRWCCHAQDEGFRIANLLHLMQLSNPLSEKSLQMGELCLKCCYCNKWFWVCCWIWSKHIFSIQHLVNFQYKLTPFDTKKGTCNKHLLQILSSWSFWKIETKISKETHFLSITQFEAIAEKYLSQSFGKSWKSLKNTILYLIYFWLFGRLTCWCQYIFQYMLISEYLHIEKRKKTKVSKENNLLNT